MAGAERAASSAAAARPVPTQRPCPACGGRSAVLLHRVPVVLPQGHPLASPFDVVGCAGCGTGFTDTPSLQGAYERHYARTAKYAGEGATQAGAAASDTPWNAARVARTAGRLRAAVPPGARVLDVGCSTGSFLAALARSGLPDVLGLDPSADSAAVAATVGVDVRVGTLGAPPADLGTFDVVVMNGVFEHLWDLPAALAAVRSLLAPGGLLYAEIPDASRYCDPFGVPFQDFNTEHVNHFSLATLDLMLRRHGFAALWSGAEDAHVSPEQTCAVTGGAWRLSGAAGPAESHEAGAVVPDEALRRSLAEFTRRSVHEAGLLDDRLRAALAGHRRVALWGVGELCYRLLGAGVLAEIEVVALADGNPARWGQRVGGVEVGPPAQLVGARTPVVLTSVLAQRSLRAAAEGLGIGDRVVELVA